MYVVPFVTNPADSQFATAGVQLTDSSNVVCNLYRMSNLHDGWRILEKQTRFPRITHSFGTLSKEDRWITHFPEELYCRTINSDYGGNALGPKKIFGLRLVGIQAEAGMFGVTKGMSDFANKMLMEALRNPKPDVQDFEGGPIFTNQVLVDKSGSKHVWWSDSGEDFPQGDGITTWNWLGDEIDASAEEKDQKNARVTMPIRNVPHLDSDYSNNEGVPLDVALIGGRSSKLHPLISRARTWNEAVYHALCQFSEPTAAAVGQKPRYDPMANRPFIAFNVSDYTEKWLDLPKKTPKPPAVFSVNWFRRDDEGNFIWDGFGANYRVLDAAVRQLEGKDTWVETPIGLVPGNGLEKGSESRGAPKKLPQAIWDEHEAFKTRVAEYCA